MSNLVSIAEYLCTAGLRRFLVTTGLQGEVLLRTVPVDGLYLEPCGGMKGWSGLTVAEAKALVSAGLAKEWIGRGQSRLLLTEAGKTARDALAASIEPAR